MVVMVILLFALRYQCILYYQISWNKSEHQTHMPHVLRPKHRVLVKNPDVHCCGLSSMTNNKTRTLVGLHECHHLINWLKSTNNESEEQKEEWIYCNEKINKLKVTYFLFQLLIVHLQHCSWNQQSCFLKSYQNCYFQHRDCDLETLLFQMCSLKEQKE